MLTVYSWFLPGFVTVKEMTRVLWSHRATAQGACASSTRAVCSNGSRAQTPAAVSFANMSSSWRRSSNHCARYDRVYIKLMSKPKVAVSFINSLKVLFWLHIQVFLLIWQPVKLKNCLQSVTQITRPWPCALKQGRVRGGRWFIWNGLDEACIFERLLSIAVAWR